MKNSVLFRLLRERIPSEDLAAFREALKALPAESYDTAVQVALRGLPELEGQIARSELRVKKLYDGARHSPLGRLHLLMHNSPPPLLLALARKCFRESYVERFDNPARSLELAEAGLQAATLVRKSGYLGVELQADLDAEAHVYLANARRINSDIRGAEGAFQEAERLIPLGTEDRLLRAQLLHEKAALRFSQGNIDAAGELYDREIRLRRLLGDSTALGTALIGRGTVAAWHEPLPTACAYLAQGAELIEDEEMLLLILNPVAERLARDGQGLAAFKVICTAELLAALSGSRSHQLRLRWVKGIAYRALGELEEAATELRAVRQELLSEELPFRAALAALDLAAVCVADGRVEEVKGIAREAYEVFRAEGLDQRALTACLIFRRAALAEELTEALAVRVANFIVGYQYDRTLRFEP